MERKIRPAFLTGGACSKELTSQFPATRQLTAKETGNKTGIFA
jgi:hypothetical protein